MAHPDPNGPLDTRPFQVGDVLENPVTGERGTLLEVPSQNPEHRFRGELLATVGARVSGEHLHPGLVEQFTVLEGELTVRLDGKTSILHEGESAAVRPGQWHDWWNAADRDARVLVEVTPGERFSLMIETLYGLGRLGYVDKKGMPNLLQMSILGREFADTIEFRSPPPAIQKATFALLAPIAHALGYRGTYPELSRTIATFAPPIK